MVRMLALLLAALPLAALAQSSPGTTVPSHSERIEVRIANVDVVVVDKKGKIVTGLKKEDFELFENGVAKPIENFYEMTSAAAAAANAAAAPGTADAPRAQPRRFILYIDNATLTMERRNHLLDQMKTFVRDTMRPGDEAMLASYITNIRVRVPFTADANAINAALDAIKSEESLGDGRLRAARETERDIAGTKDYGNRVMFARSFAEEGLNGLRQNVNAITRLMDTVGGVDGKKVLVLASEGFPIHPGREMFEWIDRLNLDATGRATEMFGTTQTRETLRAGTGTTNPAGTIAGAERTGRPMMGSGSDDLSSNKAVARSAMLDARQYDGAKYVEAIGRAANANGVTVYPIHAGAMAGGNESAADQSDVRAGSVAQGNRLNSESGLQLIADVTGGYASVKGTNHGAAFAQIQADLESYYSLGFKPAGAAGERQLKVRTKQKGLTVRARNSMMQKTPEAEMSDRVLANLLIKPRGNDLKVTITAGGQPTTEASGKVRIPLKILIPYDSLTLVEQNGGSLEGGFDVYVVATDVGGSMSPVVHRTQKVMVTSDQLASVKGANYAWTVDFLMNKNLAKVSVGIVDSVSNVASFARLE